MAGEEKITGTTDQFKYHIEKRVAYDLSDREFVDEDDDDDDDDEDDDDNDDGAISSEAKKKIKFGFTLPIEEILFNNKTFPKGELAIKVSFIWFFGDVSLRHCFDVVITLCCECVVTTLC